MVTAYHASARDQRRGGTAGAAREIRSWMPRGLQRHGLVLDINVEAGLLTWEAARRAPEGGVWSLAATAAEADVLREDRRPDRPGRAPRRAPGRAGRAAGAVGAARRERCAIRCHRGARGVGCTTTIWGHDTVKSPDLATHPLRQMAQLLVGFFRTPANHQPGGAGAADTQRLYAVGGPRLPGRRIGR